MKDRLNKPPEIQEPLPEPKALNPDTKKKVTEEKDDDGVKKEVINIHKFDPYPVQEETKQPTVVNKKKPVAVKSKPEVPESQPVVKKTDSSEESPAAPKPDDIEVSPNAKQPEPVDKPKPVVKPVETKPKKTVEPQPKSADDDLDGLSPE